MIGSIPFAKIAKEKHPQIFAIWKENIKKVLNFKQ